MANKVILVGNVGKTPEVRTLDSGAKVANFTLATTEKGYKTKNGTDIPDKTTWHNLVAWKGLAEIAEKHISKGTKLYIEGKIDNRNYDDTGGIKRYVSEIIISNFEFLGSKSNESSDDPTPPPQSGEGDDLPF